MVNSVLAYEHKLQKQRANDERTQALERQLHQTKVIGEVSPLPCAAERCSAYSAECSTEHASA
jgi:hypothetical protein